MGSIFGDILCFIVGCKLSAMGYMKLIPLFGIPSYVLQFMSKQANCWQSLLIGRFVSQIAYGISHMAVPIFLMEIADPASRGSVVMLSRVCGVLASALGSLLGHHFLLGTEERWNWVFVLLMGIALSGLVGLLFIPNSPEHFIATGDEESARKSFQFYQGIKEVSKAPLKKVNKKADVTTCGLEVSAKDLCSVILVALAMTIIVLRSIYRELMLYSTVVFELFGFPTGTAQTMTVVTKCAVVGMALVAPYVVSVVSGRKLYLIACGSSAAGLTLLASYKFWPIVTGLEWLFALTTSYCLLVGWVALSLYYVIIPEIFPFEIGVRSKATILIFMDSASALSTFTSFPALEYFGPSTFWFNAIPLWICVGFLLIKMPETKNRPTEEILRDFSVIR